MELKFKQIISGTILPNGRHNDLRSMFPVTVAKQDYAVIRTGLGVDVPQGFELHITSKKKLAEEKQVAVLNAPGVIHPGSEEEIVVILINHSVIPFHVEEGDSIAQLSLVPVAKFKPVFG